MKINKRAIWKKLKLPLLVIPCCILPTTAGLIVITVIGGLDDAITKWQIAGHWWIILIIGYVLTLIYFLYEPIYRRDQKIKKYVSALILYWETLFAKQNKPQPSKDVIEKMREELLERVKVWAWFDSKLWSRFYPEEKYSEYPFDIVDSLMAKWEEWQSKATGEAIGGEAGFRAEFSKYMLSGNKKEK